MDEIERRLALGDFLRSRRARLSPSDVDLPQGFRRRTPGLRREEVAQLANIGTSWYISLEQGRDVHPSEPVLESLAQALKLNDDERQHLFLLALGYIPMRMLPPGEEVTPGLQQVVRSLDPSPAYIVGRRWDLLTWNSAAELVFTFSRIPPPHTRNVVWRAFTDPILLQAQRDPAHVARISQGMIAQFRADSARYPGDPYFAELIADLQQASALFREWWPRHDVLSVPDCHKEMNHHIMGYLEFEMVTLQVPTSPNLRMMIYSASTATSATLEKALQGSYKDGDVSRNGRQVEATL
jgi:transcriptional regulator with XRE-family HTH domain